MVGVVNMFAVDWWCPSAVLFLARDYNLCLSCVGSKRVQVSVHILRLFEQRARFGLIAGRAVPIFRMANNASEVY